MSEVHISSAEWEVMRVVWTMEQTTSNEIIAVLSGKMEWKPATIKTLVGRLVKKGMLDTEKSGRKYLYSAAVTEKESVKESGKDFLSQICAKKRGNTLASMVEDSLLSQQDIEQLELILTEKKKTAPESVPCQCVPGQCDCHHSHDEKVSHAG